MKNLCFETSSSVFAFLWACTGLVFVLSKSGRRLCDISRSTAWQGSKFLFSVRFFRETRVSKFYFIHVLLWNFVIFYLCPFFQYFGLSLLSFFVIAFETQTFFSLQFLKRNPFISLTKGNEPRKFSKNTTRLGPYKYGNLGKMSPKSAWFKSRAKQIS